jgi:hypothetical protein
MPPKPMIINAQLAGSGTSPGKLTTPPRRTCLTSSKLPLVVKLNLSIVSPLVASALKKPFGRMSKVLLNVWPAVSRKVRVAVVACRCRRRSGTQ